MTEYQKHPLETLSGLATEIEEREAERLAMKPRQCGQVPLRLERETTGVGAGSVRRSSACGRPRGVFKQRMSEPFHLPFSSREERIAHNEAWARSLNERRAEWVSGREELTGFRCECWERDCSERVLLSPKDWEMARAEPNRFVVAPGHVADQVEAMVKDQPRFWIVEKHGEAGKIAQELARS